MLIEKFRATLKRHSMLCLGDRVLVGVSGGADSLALLYALHSLNDELSLSLRIAHLNHKLRPEADQEAAFVQEIAHSLKLPFSLGKEDVPCYQQREKLSLEVAARELRYRFFDHEATRHNCNKIALGHTADDQAETVLMRLLRGTGPRGLAGIPPVREGRYIRPLIEVSRREVETFLAAQGLEYILDSSNASTQHLRNKIRLELIPFLEREYNPQIGESLIGLADIMRQEETFLEGYCHGLLNSLQQKRVGGKLALDSKKLRNLPPGMQRRVLRQGVQEVKGDMKSISRRQLEAVLDLLKGEETGKCCHLSGLIIQRGYGELIFFCPEKAENLNRVLVKEKLPVPGFKAVPVLGWTFRTTLKQKDEIDFHIDRERNQRALLDYRKLSGLLIIRTRMAGDRFHPLGSTGSQKLKKFFIDHRVPRQDRDRIPLLVSQNEVLWVVGMRISERVRMTGDTREVLEVAASRITPASPEK